MSVGFSLRFISSYKLPLAVWRRDLWTAFRPDCSPADQLTSYSNIILIDSGHIEADWQPGRQGCLVVRGEAVVLCEHYKSVYVVIYVCVCV